ncbi:FAD-dependent monooxygenase [Thalassotalea ganghwensis]
MNNFDCIVSGGGMVGAAAALSMAQLGLTVAVVEKHEPKAFNVEQPHDIRVSAISIASQQLLESLDSWQYVVNTRAAKYSRLGVWEQDYSYTEFNANEIEQPHLGHIVENRVIQLALWQQLKHHDNITILCPDSISSIKQSEKEIMVSLAEQDISARVLIAADGANSAIRQMAGIGITGWDYQQSAMLINVETQAGQQDITWQQFTPSGPLAMLPLTGHQASLVWYDDKDKIKQLSQLSSEQLCHLINQTFPKKLGEVKRVLASGAFGLTRRHANRYQQGRVLLLGDAAHTINPLAGQGVNLGFKDVHALKTLVAKAIGEGKCWHDTDTLAQYEQARRCDNLLMMSTMDAFYQVFSKQLPGLAKLRNLGLTMVNKVPVLKKKVLAHACGL